MAKVTTKKTTKPVKKNLPAKKKPLQRKRKTNIMKTATVEEKVIKEWLENTGLANQLQEHEVIQFIRIAKAYNLNPFKKEIFCNVYNANDPDKRTLSIVIGYKVFIKRAEKINLLDGWGCQIQKEDGELKAICTIYRKDWKFPFVHESWFSECVQKTRQGNINAFWKKMPKFMLKKVCIAQAFRLCFPNEDMPYIQEEDYNFDRQYNEPINSELKKVDTEKYEKLTYKKDEQTESETKKPWEEFISFINENQKVITSKGIAPSKLIKDTKGQPDDVIIKALTELKEVLNG